MRRIILAFLRLLPASLAEGLARVGLRALSLTRPPGEGLRRLVALDSYLYGLLGKPAAAWEGGDHPKHRLTGYHDFFVGRLERGWRVLDVGCGTGVLARDMAERAGVRVLGVEIEPANVAEARDRHAHPDVQYVEGDVLARMPEGPFDAVVLSNVLEHLTDRPGVLRRAAAQCPSGRLLVRVPLFDRDWRVPLKRELGLDWRADPTHETEYTLESFLAEVAEAGLAPAHLEVRWGEIWCELG
jgi:SAM-dependent methyltransferase